MFFDRVKTLMILGMFVAGFAIGGGVVRYFWLQDQLQQEQEYKQQLQQALENAERQKEQSAIAESELLDKLDALRNRYNASLSDIERMRGELSKPVRTVAKNSCKPCENRLAQCQGLLGEGIGLASEGAELSERIALKKDSIVERLAK